MGIWEVKHNMMDSIKIGSLICELRLKGDMTQKQLAQKLNISDKTVSKWERGAGFPDLSLLPDIADIFEINLEDLLRGEIDTNDTVGGNMKNIKFYVCPNCGNMITSTAAANVSCCGKNLEELVPVKAEEPEKLSVEIIDGEYYISSDHEMNKEHYITFVAIATGDSVNVKKQYPEWDLQVRIPKMHGKLIWHCSNHGLFYQLI